MRSGLRARSTANRSGARGKTTCQAANAKESDQLDPECVRLERRPAPIPRTAIVSGEAVPVKATLRHAKNRHGLDRDRLPTKNTLLGRGNGSSWNAVLPFANSPVPGSTDIGEHIGFTLDTDRPSHRSAEGEACAMAA